MRSQVDREKQAVEIASALGVFAAVLLVAAFLAWVLATQTHVLDQHGHAFLGAAVVLAGAVACARLGRSGDR